MRNKFIKDIVKAAKRNQALNKPDTPSPNYESSYASNSFDTSTDQLHPTNIASSAWIGGKNQALESCKELVVWNEPIAATLLTSIDIDGKVIIHIDWLLCTS